MMSIITAFLGRYAMILGIAGIVGVGAIAGVLWWQKSSAEKRVASLQIDVDRLQGQVIVLKLAKEDQEAAIRELEQTNSTLAKQATALNETLEELRNAPDSEDGPISVLLNRLLERLDRLRDGSAADPR